MSQHHQRVNTFSFRYADLFHYATVEHMERRQIYRIAMSDAESESIREAYGAPGVPLSTVIRLALGLPMLTVGGARPGAGRPKKKAKKGG